MHQTTFWARQRWDTNAMFTQLLRSRHFTHSHTKARSSLFISVPWFRTSLRRIVRFRGQWPKTTKKDERSLQTSNILETQREEAVSLGHGRIQTKTKQARRVCAYFCAHRNVCRLFRFYHIVITYIIGKAYLFVFVRKNFECGGFIGGWTPLSLSE